MKRKIFFGLLLTFGVSSLYAQKGNVGIGTTTPDQSAILDIQSTNKGFLAPRLTLNQRNEIPMPATGLLVYQTDFVSGFYYFNGDKWNPLTENEAKSIAGTDGDWTLGGNIVDSNIDYLGTANDQPLIFRINTANNTLWNEKMRLTSTGLGVGGLIPTEAIDVLGNVKATGNITGQLVNTFSRTYLQGKDNVGYHWFASSPTVAEPNNIMMGIQRDPATDFVENIFLAPGGNFALTIANTGKVKVGSVTTPDGYNLFVQGGILTEKVKVAVSTSADWADYVFEKDYQLMPLKDVETFIKANKHLPNVPSAEQFATEGLDVTKTSAMLMEKIEELTLYVLELNTKVSNLEKENKYLKTYLK